jgi:hypothetical protein
MNCESIFRHMIFKRIYGKKPDYGGNVCKMMEPLLNASTSVAGCAFFLISINNMYIS